MEESEAVEGRSYISSVWGLSAAKLRSLPSERSCG